jgi:ATPase subunit of ABC transporter with duplicated ATPase domains
VGKSSLLKAIGWGLVVGFPKNLRCLYVDQLEGVDLQQSCLEVVLQADAPAQRAQRESAALEAALEGGDGAEIAHALRTLRLQRLRDEAAEAQQTAERRSGERGLAARQALVAAEARLADAEAQLGAPVGDQELHGALGAAQDLLTELFDQLSLLEPEEAEGQARAILTGLGFSQEQQEAPLGQLSGAYSGAAGWVVAVSMAAGCVLDHCCTVAGSCL